MENKNSTDLQKFLVNRLLNLPKNQKLNSKVFMFEAFEVVMQNKRLSKKLLTEIYHKVLPTCHDPLLMKKLFGRQGVDFKAAIRK